MAELFLPSTLSPLFAGLPRRLDVDAGDRRRGARPARGTVARFSRPPVRAGPCATATHPRVRRPSARRARHSARAGLARRRDRRDQRRLTTNSRAPTIRPFTRGSLTCAPRRGLGPDPRQGEVCGVRADEQSEGVTWTSMIGTSRSSRRRSRTVTSSRSWARGRTSATGRRRLPGSWAASPRAAVSWPGRSPRTASIPRPAIPDLLWVSQYFDAVLGGGHAVQEAPRRLRLRLSAELAPPAARASAGASARAAPTRAARPDHELRRPGRARVRGRRRARSTSSRTRRSPGPSSRATSEHRPPGGDPSVDQEAGNKYSGLSLARAASDPEVARRRSTASNKEDGTATSSPRTATSTTWQATIGQQADSARAAGKKMSDSQLSLPRLLDARLEHARDPEAASGASNELGSKSWSVQLAQAEGKRGARSSSQLWCRRGDVDLIYRAAQGIRRAARRGLTAAARRRAMTDTLAPPPAS